MSTDAARLTAQVALRPLTHAAWARVALTTLVVASVAIRLPLALLRDTPRYFPDEYLYGELARSLAAGRGFTVLGTDVGLPALVEPLVASLAWLPGDPALAFRLTQLVHVLAMALAAVPVYLVARRLGVGDRTSLAVAAVASVSPGLLYGGYATADALGYLAALVAVHACVRAVGTPTLARQAWLVAAVGIAACTRVQYALLLPAAAVGALASRRWSPRAALRALPLPFAALAVGAAAVAVAGSGRYSTSTGVGSASGAIAWAAESSWLLALAAGVLIVPGAAVWLGATLVRPRTAERAAFAGLAATLLAATVCVAGLMSSTTASERFLERYLLLGIPLLALAFAAWTEEGRRGRRVAAGLAAALVALVALHPLSEFSAGQGAADSPFLLALTTLERALGVGSASLAAAGAVTVLALAASGLALAWTSRAAVTLAGTVAVLALVSVGAHAADIRLSASVRASQLPADASWVDHASAGDVLLVQTAESSSARAMSQAFWNASVTTGALLGGAEPMDGALRRISIGPDGALTLAGRALSGPLLLATGGSRPVLANAAVLASGPSFRLVRPDGQARLAGLLEGLHDDGWLGARARLTVYPGPAGCRTLAVTLGLPAGTPGRMLDVVAGGVGRTVRVAPGRPVTVEAASARRAPATVIVRARSLHTAAGADARPVSVRAVAELRPAVCD